MWNEHIYCIVFFVFYFYFKSCCCFKKKKYTKYFWNLNVQERQQSTHKTHTDWRVHARGFEKLIDDFFLLFIGLFFFLDFILF